MTYQYLSVYDGYKNNDPQYEKTKVNDYPQKLCEYIFQKFNLRTDETLLDVGCGMGEYMEGFKKLGLKVSGLDRENSPVAAKLDIKTGLDIEKDIFPFMDSSFDIVFSKSVIAHLWRPDNYIKEIYRVLRPGGKIIIMTPDWKNHLYVFYDDFTMVHPYTSTSLERLLRAYGFSNVKADIFYTRPIVWKYPWLKIISKLFQLFGPVKKNYKNQFIRWSMELMVLGSATK